MNNPFEDTFRNPLRNGSPEAYQQATPFPFGLFDNFLNPTVLKGVLEEWPSDDNFSFKSCATSIKYHLTDSFTFGPKTQKLFRVLNDPKVLQEMETLTGIKGLIADDGLMGGGLHMIPRGGFLTTHSDFNYMESSRLTRKLNLLIYLNENWEKDWGGNLELVGPPDRLDTKVIVAPVMNRAVLFNTTSDSYHGHPYPLKCPVGRSRKSLAIYYYKNEGEPKYTHSTLYRPDLVHNNYPNVFNVY